MCIRDRVILTTGLLMTVIDVGKEVQKVVDEVNVTLAVPTDIPVIKPLLFIVAIAGLKLVHVPLPPVVLVAFDAVSYTHLDVYKRQTIYSTRTCKVVCTYIT